MVMNEHVLSWVNSLALNELYAEKYEKTGNEIRPKMKNPKMLTEK